MHIQKYIVRKMKKKLKVTDDYLANYLGVSLSTLNDWQQQSSWEGKAQRLYLLNKLVNVLHNKGIKNPQDLKNTLDNSRFKSENMDEDCSYITYILAQANIDDLIYHLVYELKEEFLLKNLNISKENLNETITRTDDNYISKINILYYVIKYLIRKGCVDFNFSLFQKNFKTLKSLTILDYANNNKYIFSNDLDHIIKELQET